ncbi:HlyD family secretion protein [Tenacibaculum sp. 190524A02b]|uniref:HlyD family secretion protein n=1 Tax=Tenacibaculum vairaonense TaxID=3137860 RepID=UPI0031FAEB78
MENSILYRTKPLRIIVLLFKVTVLFLILFLGILFFLNVDDTVYFNNGLVYSKNPKTQINSPVSGTITTIKIREGQEVKKGDTLLVLQNKEVISNYYISYVEKETTEQDISYLKEAIIKANKEKSIYEKQRQVKSKMFHLKRLNLQQELIDWSEKINLAAKSYTIAKSKFKTDSILYTKGVISRINFEKEHKKLLSEKQSFIGAKSIVQKKKYELENLVNKEFETEKNIETKLLNLDKTIAFNKLNIEKLNLNKKKIQYNQEYIKEKKDKLFICAPTNGSISFIYNTKQNLQEIEKGIPLVTISPKEETFYAKINVAEQDILYLKKGQKVQLNFNAYNYYKYGGIQGKINYISPTKQKGNFYCIVDFNKMNSNIQLKTDYSIKGTIVVGHLKTYEYIFKKVFSKLE